MNYPVSSDERAIPVAGDGEVYLLKWHTFQSHFTNGLKNLFLEADPLADVTLSSEGRYIRTHKLLLSLCSPYFKHMFQVNQAQSSNMIVVLNNVKFKDLENLVHFIYNGEVKVKNTDLSGFLQTGELLQIEGLANCASPESENTESTSQDQSHSQNSRKNDQTMAGQQSQSSSPWANPVQVQVSTPISFPIRVHPHHKSAHRSVKRAKYTVQATGRSLHVPVTSSVSDSYNTSGGTNIELSGEEIETDPLALHYNQMIVEEANPLMENPLEDHVILIDSIKREGVGQSVFMNENDADFETTEPPERGCVTDVGGIFTSSLSMNEGVNSLPGPSSAISSKISEIGGILTIESENGSDNEVVETQVSSKPRSWVWDHFIKKMTTNDKMEKYKMSACLYCSVTYNLSKTGGSTANLIKHIQGKHPEKIQV